jgi:hypothetical protein
MPAHLIEIAGLTRKRRGDMADDVVGNALRVVRLDLVGFKGRLPGGLVAHRPFFTHGTTLGGKVGSF